MIEITNYIVERTDNHNICTVTVGDTYPLYQVYVDNILIQESFVPVFNVNIPRNSKVDVLGVNSWDQTRDFSASLDDDNGDKIEIYVPTNIGKVNIYGGVTVIDYGRPLNRFPIDLSTIPSNGSYGIGQFGLTTFGLADNGYRRIFITSRIETGPYMVAVVAVEPNSAFYHNPIVVSKTIATTPDEITPFISACNLNL